MPQGIEEWLRGWLAGLGGVDRTAIDRDSPMSRYGLDSAAVFELVQAIEERLGVKLPPTALYEYPTVTKLAAYLAEM
jgi:acyl carrier protein